MARLLKNLEGLREYCKAHVFDDMTDLADEIYHSDIEDKNLRAKALALIKAQSDFYIEFSKTGIAFHLMGDSLDLLASRDLDHLAKLADEASYGDIGFSDEESIVTGALLRKIHNILTPIISGKISK